MVVLCQHIQSLLYLQGVVGKGVVVGQGLVLQGCVSVAEPLQVFPPYAGRGLVHVLVHTCVPPPQVREHGALFHAVQPPSTETEKLTH